MKIPSNLSLLPDINRPGLVEDRYKKLRREALISMSYEKIKRIMVMNGQEIPKNKKMFWTIVHQTRAVLPEIPWEYRMKSKKWLELSDDNIKGELSEWL